MLAIFLLSGVFVGENKTEVALAIDNSTTVDDKIEKAEDKIKDYQKKIKKVEKRKQATVQVANEIKGGINKISKNIKNIQGEAKRTEAELDRLEEDIKKTEDKITNRRERMTKIIRKINRQKIDLRMILLDSNKGLEEYIASRDAMEMLQINILNNLKDLKERRRDLKKIKEKKAEAKDKLNSQKTGLERERVKKSWLLSQKNEEINKHDEKIKGIQRKIDKLNSTLSSFLGKSFNTNDIVKAVKFASRKTGVRREFLMAMLDKETDLGRFTGGCTYKNTRVRDNDKKIFKQICKDLGYDYKKKKISCSLSYGYGGAMGVAQFMPSTWAGYKSRISSYTGHKPANPWSLTDGVMGMAIKLRDAGASKKSGEYRASAIYYCGGNWKRTVCKNYANTVKSWAKGGYEEYF